MSPNTARNYPLYIESSPQTTPNMCYDAPAITIHTVWKFQTFYLLNAPEYKRISFTVGRLDCVYSRMHTRWSSSRHRYPLQLSAASIVRSIYIEAIWYIFQYIHRYGNMESLYVGMIYYLIYTWYTYNDHIELYLWVNGRCNYYWATIMLQGHSTEPTCLLGVLYILPGADYGHYQSSQHTGLLFS